jgi:anti-sigma B factor antagonist
METSIRRVLTAEGTATVAVAGEIDFTNADEVSGCIEGAVAEWEPSLVRVDLEHATFIDSTGLGALIAGYRAATGVDCVFEVVNVSPSFHRVLDVTGLCDLFGLPALRGSDFAI